MDLGSGGTVLLVSMRPGMVARSVAEPLRMQVDPRLTPPPPTSGLFFHEDVALKVFL